MYSWIIHVCVNSTEQLKIECSGGETAGHTSISYFSFLTLTPEAASRRKDGDVMFLLRETSEGHTPRSPAR